MKKVAMLTTFQGYLESYSLCAVAITQLRMFKKNGYACRFIYRGGDDGPWKKHVEDVQLIPDYIAENDGSTGPVEQRTSKKFEELVDDTYNQLKGLLEGYDVVITHDLFFQDGNRIQNAAAARIAKENPKLLWLHWIHSATSARDKNKKAKHKYPNSFICYPNSYDIPRIADNFGFEEVDVKVVPHPIDYADHYLMHPITERLIDEKGILNADVIGVYPLRLDRGKQPEWGIRIFNQIKKKFNRVIRYIIIDFQSTGGDKVTYRNEMKDMAVKMGWGSNDLIFMSEFDPSCKMQTPKMAVRDLQILADVHIHPSRSETYSLVCQEARASRSLLMLNYDFPAMKSIYGDGPIYRKFESNVDVHSGQDGSTNVDYKSKDPSLSGKDAFARDCAGNIVFHLDHQSVLRGAIETRKNKNIITVFKKHVEPLFYAKEE